MWIFFPLVLSSIMVIISKCFNIEILLISYDDSFHFGIITVCSIFAGFLYTNYGILLDFSDTKLGKELSRTNIIKKRNRHITYGIFSSVISIVSGLLLTLKINEGISLWINTYASFLTMLIYYFEIFFTFTTIILFIKSLQEMKSLVNQNCKQPIKIDASKQNNIEEQLKRT